MASVVYFGSFVQLLSLKKGICVFQPQSIWWVICITKYSSTFSANLKATEFTVLQLKSILAHKT